MRRFFRFSVRDLLWLTLVVAVGLGWFVRERRLSELQGELIESQGRTWTLEEAITQEFDYKAVWLAPTKVRLERRHETIPWR